MDKNVYNRALARVPNEKRGRLRDAAQKMRTSEEPIISIASQRFSPLLAKSQEGWSKAGRGNDASGYARICIYEIYMYMYLMCSHIVTRVFVHISVARVYCIFVHKFVFVIAYHSPTMSPERMPVAFANRSGKQAKPCSVCCGGGGCAGRVATLRAGAPVSNTFIACLYDPQNTHKAQAKPIQHVARPRLLS